MGLEGDARKFQTQGFAAIVERQMVRVNGQGGKSSPRKGFSNLKTVFQIGEVSRALKVLLGHKEPGIVRRVTFSN